MPPVLDINNFCHWLLCSINSPCLSSSVTYKNLIRGLPPCVTCKVLPLCHTYLLTPWSRVILEKLTGFVANQEIPRILWNLKVHYRTHNRPPPVPILSQLHPVPTTPFHFLKIHLKIMNYSCWCSSGLSLYTRLHCDVKRIISDVPRVLNIKNYSCGRSYIVKRKKLYFPVFDLKQFFFFLRRAQTI